VTGPLRVTSKDNPLLQRLRKLARDGAAYRKTGELWLEGEHLCSALLQRGMRPAQAVLAEAAWAQPALRALGQAAPTCSATSGWTAMSRTVPSSTG